jgi:hypothetical protein
MCLRCSSETCKHTDCPHHGEHCALVTCHEEYCGVNGEVVRCEEEA